MGYTEACKMLSKAIDLVADRRNPLFLLPNYIKKKGLASELARVKIPPRTIVDVAITFDVEYDLGSAGKKESKCVGPFLKKIGKILGNKIPATFFVQGNVMGPHHRQLLALQKKGHEIGLHGWAHEPWGEAWFIKDRAPSLKEREELLKKSLSEFEKYGLERPVSFRAPNMVISKDSLSLLEKCGFRIDSSAPSFKGVPPVITRIRKIMEIPVSADPVPAFSSKLASSHSVFNMFNVSKGAFHAENVVKFQLLKKQKPFLVFLAHPWEFFPNKKFQYCSKSNFQLICKNPSISGTLFRHKPINVLA